MSTDLQHARQRIDAVDAQIVQLLAERQSIVDDIADQKAASGDAVKDADREDVLLTRLCTLARDAGLTPELVTRLWEQILAHSVQRQRRRLAVQRPHAGDGQSTPPPRVSVRDASNASGASSCASSEASGETPGDVSNDCPYRLAHRAQNPGGTVIRAGRSGAVRVGGDAPVWMAGPCSVESREQIMRSAEAVARAGGHILRGGCFKPRTSPYSFQGLGEEGLDLLVEAGRTFGLPVITEALAPEHVPLVAEKADIIQIGSRNMQNFSLLRACGDVQTPVMLKRGMTATIREWLCAAEYILSGGNPNVILCERGIRTFVSETRNTLDLAVVPVLRERTHLPIVIDPAHATGKRSLVPSLARAALAAGADGVMVEAHPNPDEALSDGPQSLHLHQLHALLGESRVASAHA